MADQQSPLTIDRGTAMASTRRRDLATIRNLPRSALMSYARKRLDPGLSHSAVATAVKNYPNLFALLDTNIFAWASAYLRHRFGPRHKFLDYGAAAEDTGVYALGSAKDEIRISLAGDWASGTDEAADVAAAITESQPHFAIHLGDVYYVGDDSEVRSTCLGENACQYDPTKWPTGSMGTFALNGNHEMYARGTAYFDTLLPKLGMTGQSPQRASFFCLENEHWQVIALDTGYNSVKWPLLEGLPFWPFAPSFDLSAAQIRWLTDVVKPSNGSRGVIVLTHHPPYSRFQPSYVKPARQLKALMRAPVLWFWGHEHRVTVYDRYSCGGGIEAYGRCLGHGGMPVELNPQVVDSRCPLLFTDAREYRNDEQIKVGYNGYANLTFTGSSLRVEYRDLRAACVLAETWQVVNGTLLRASAQ